jgi:hypothetical protein
MDNYEPRGPFIEVRQGRLGLPRSSHWFRSLLGADVDGTQEGSWGRCLVGLALHRC